MTINLFVLNCFCILIIVYVFAVFEFFFVFSVAFALHFQELPSGTFPRNTCAIVLMNFRFNHGRFLFNSYAWGKMNDIFLKKE